MSDYGRTKHLIGFTTQCATINQNEVVVPEQDGYFVAGYIEEEYFLIE